MKHAMLLALGSLGLVACSDPPCGPGTAPDDGLVLAGPALDVRFHALTAGANNDCPAVDAPDGVVSLTIAGTQVGDTSPITFCVPRPDLLGAGARALGADIQVIDVFADAGGCALRLANVPAITGTVTSSGVCVQGTDPAGFSLSFDGGLTLRRDCAGTIDDINVTLTGAVAISGAN